MQWVIDNWVLVLLGGGMVAMHLFGHGHGHGHGRKGRHRGAGAAPDDRADAAAPQTPSQNRDDGHA